MLRLIALFLVLHFNVCFADPSPINQAIKKVDHYIQEQIKEKKSVGCAVAVVDHGKVIFIKAYGNRKQGEKSPVNLETAFSLGSLSKPIVATLVAILVKENLLKLDALVSHFYPNISSATTVQHVLSHTTGYKRTGWNQKIEAHQSRKRLLQQLADAPQINPGDRYDYHNLAYTLIEEIITSSLQQPFKETLEVKLLRPLGMKGMYVGDLDFSQHANYAWPHQENKKGAMRPCKGYSRAYHRSVVAAGGISGNIKDMATFLQLQMEGKLHFLDVQDLLAFHSPVTEAPDAKRWFQKYFNGDLTSYYGLGWRIMDSGEKRIIFHGGYLKGFINFLGFIPDQHIGIVILHNGENPLSAKAALMFLGAL